jgi:WD40 repeat protein
VTAFSRGAYCQFSKLDHSPRQAARPYVTAPVGQPARTLTTSLSSLPTVLVVPAPTIRGMGLAAAPLARCGGLVSAAAAAWDSSSGALVVASGRHVRVHAVPVAARRPRTLAAHDHDVVAVAALGPARALTASEDGILCVWDIEDAVCLRMLDVGAAVMGVAAPRFDCGNCDGFVAVACAKGVFLVSVVDKAAPRRALWNLRMERVACSERGLLVAATLGRVLHLAHRGKSAAEGDDAAAESVDREDRKRGSVTEVLQSFTVPNIITSVAVSPDGTTVAVGDVVGCIYVFQDFAEHAEAGGGTTGKRRRIPRVVPSKLHWHSNAVLSLRFSADGNILLSGGAEAVLVSWNMSRSDFGDRSFRPRLGGALWGIAASPNERMYAVTCADNAVRVLDAYSMSLMSIFQGLAVPPMSTATQATLVSRRSVLQRVRKMSILPEPGHDGCVLVTGIGGAVQVYDVHRGEHVGFFPVVPRNLVFTGGGKDVKPHTPSVRHACMSKDRESMATVDVERTADDHEILRFWHRSETGDTLDPVARIEKPHGPEGRVTGVQFHSSLPIVATSSSAGTVKIWRLVHTGVQARPLSWRCEAEQSRRGLACNSLSFSADGSMLAVAAGSSVELWRLAFDAAAVEEADSEQVDRVVGSVVEGSPTSLALELLHTFVHPPLKELVLDVAFVTGVLPAIVAITKNGVYVWNVLAQCIWWSLRLVTGNKRITVDAAMQRFAIAVDVPKALPEERSKKNGGKKNTPNANKGKVSQPALVANADAVDKGLVLFNVSSPVPLGVHRLPHGSRPLTASFVSLPQKDMTSGGFCPLVYVDCDLEVHMIADNVDSDLVSAVTEPELDDDAAGANPEGGNHLDALLGADWREEAKTRAKSTAAVLISGTSVVSSNLASSFAGATHTQASVTKTAMGAISRLLREASLERRAAAAMNAAGALETPSAAEEGLALYAARKARPATASTAVNCLTSKSGRAERMARVAAFVGRL